MAKNTHTSWLPEQDIYFLKLKIQGKQSGKKLSTKQIARKINKEFGIKKTVSAINSHLYILKKEHGIGKLNDLLQKIQEKSQKSPADYTHPTIQYDSSKQKTPYFWTNKESLIYIQGKMNNLSPKEISDKIKKETGYVRSIISVRSKLINLKKEHGTDDLAKLLEIYSTKSGDLNEKLFFKEPNGSGLAGIIGKFNKNNLDYFNEIYTHLKTQANGFLLDRYLSLTGREAALLDENEKKKYFQAIKKASANETGILETLDVVLLQSSENYALLPVDFNSLNGSIQKKEDSPQKTFYEAFAAGLEANEFTPYGKVENLKEIVKIAYKKQISNSEIPQLKETINDFLKGQKGFENLELNFFLLNDSFYSFLKSNER